MERKMPTYEYVCTSCGRRFELLQSFSDDPLETCGECGGRLRRVFHPVGVMFKGSGFYSTDSKSHRSSGDGRPKKSESEKGESAKSEPAKTADSSPKPSPEGSG